MAMPIASVRIYAHSPDYPERSRIISPIAVFRVANVRWRVNEAVGLH
jgi:hypothetical protein